MTTSAHNNIDFEQVQVDLVRRRTLSGGYSRELLDNQITSDVAYLADQLAGSVALSGPPPKSIASAMALALFTTPYLCPPAHNGPLSRWSPEQFYGPKSTITRCYPTALLSELLDLPIEKLDALQAQVDKAMGRFLQQSRLIGAVFHLFDLPQASQEPLFEQLFPIIPALNDKSSLHRTCSSIYAVVAQDPGVLPAELFMPWLSEFKEGSFAPLHSFQPKLVNDTIITTLARSLGLPEDNIPDLLASVAVILPQRNKTAMFRHDIWRSSGLATLTGLGEGYRRAQQLLSTPRTRDLSVKTWLLNAEGGYTARYARTAFHDQLVARLATGFDAMHAELVASHCFTAQETDATPSHNDLDLLDISRHIQALGAPLLTWIAAPSTVVQVATICCKPLSDTADLLAQVSDIWVEQFDTEWINPKKSSAHARRRDDLMRHIVSHQHTLRTVMARPPIRGIDHRQTLLAFSGFLLKSTTPKRLFSTISHGKNTWPGSTMAHTNDNVSAWFWRLWRQLQRST